MTSNRIPIDGAYTQEISSDSSSFYKDYWIPNSSISAESLKRHQEMIQYVFTTPPRALRIAELGVGGEGGILALIKEYNEVFGFDVSESAIQMCLERGVPCQKYNGDRDALPFEDDSLDAVFACEVFEHLANPQYALEELRRVLKPGGLAAFSIPNRLIHHWPRLFYPALIDKEPFREFLMINRFKIRKEVGIGSNHYKSVLSSEQDSWSWFWVCENIKSNNSEELFINGMYFLEKRNNLGIRVAAIEACDLLRASWNENRENLEAAFALALALTYRVINGERNEFQTLLSLIQQHLSQKNSPNAVLAERYLTLIQKELAQHGIGIAYRSE